jgi:hypothetical protein
MNTLEIANRVIAEGKPYTVSHVNEGSCESGPWASTSWGYRLGKLKVELSANGALWLDTGRWDEDYGMPKMWELWGVGWHYTKASDEKVAHETLKDRVCELRSVWYRELYANVPVREM